MQSKAMTATRQRPGPISHPRNLILTLILVGVVLDTMRQLEAQLQMRHYDKFLRRGVLG